MKYVDVSLLLQLQFSIGSDAHMGCYFIDVAIKWWWKVWLGELSLSMNCIANMPVLANLVALYLRRKIPNP